MAERDVPVAHPPVVALDLPAGATRTLVADVRHDATGYTLPMEVRPAEAAAFHASRWRRGVAQGVFVGLLLGLAAYNLFLFGTLHDRSYLFYVLFLAGSVIYWGVSEGFILEFLWPSTAPGLFELHFFGLALAAGCYVLFARSFLRTADHAPRLDGTLRVLAALWVVWAAGGLAAMAGAPLWIPVQIAAALTALTMLCATLAAGVCAHVRGYVPARYYLLASAPVVVTGLLFTLEWLGWASLPWEPLAAFQAGTAAEAILFAMALSSRIRILDRARADAVEARRVAEATNAALRETDALRTDLLGFAAHDLRSPLTGVVGYAELVADEAPPGSDLRDYAAVIQKDAARMLALIDDLLVTAALDGRNVELDPSPTDLAPLLAEVADAFRPRAEAKGQSLGLDVPDGPVRAALDRDRFREVLDNLVSNAVKYTPTGGAIRLTLVAGDDVRVTVADNGPGLTAEDQAKLFGRFQRLSARPTGGESSTGLGLSIARDLVALHGGTIEVESAHGEGATFTVRVPRLSERRPAPLRRSKKAAA